MIYVEIVLMVLLIVMLISDIGVMVRINKRLDNCNKCYKEKYDISNKKKALEIIKENCEFDFREIDVNDYVEFAIRIRSKNKYQLFFTCLDVFLKTQAEFDLLKEVLKDESNND